jgi:hypothetical protein
VSQRNHSRIALAELQPAYVGANAHRVCEFGLRIQQAVAANNRESRERLRASLDEQYRAKRDAELASQRDERGGRLPGGRQSRQQMRENLDERYKTAAAMAGHEEEE